MAAPVIVDMEARPDVQFLTVGDFTQMTVVNYGPAVLSYGSTVAANEGTIAASDSAVLTAGLWVKASPKTRVQAIAVAQSGGGGGGGTPELGSITLAMLSDELKAVLVSGRVHDGANYPPREDGFALDVAVGPTQPDDFEDGDLWPPTT